MDYRSTRSDRYKATSAEAILSGLAPDGGLYSMEDLKEIRLDWRKTLDLDTRGMAVEILSALLPSFSKDEMKELVLSAYEGKFETEDLTPTVRLGDDTVLELFRGPTSAFKDVALSMLPVLMTASRAKCGVKDEILILTATSGDTGKAAMEGFRDVPGTRIIVFYPYQGVSAIQQAQMTTQKGSNVSVCAVRGNFDDAQTGVKRIFSEVLGKGLLDGKGVRLSSANSINIGRLAPQVVYYFRAYADMVRRGQIQKGDAVDFVVPTGNFGDILAGYFARELGLPVGKLVCASNANNILTDLLHTGRYDCNRPFFKTISPSMDILVSSNFERLLYLLCRDARTVSSLMHDLSTSGAYELPVSIKEQLDQIFWAGCCGDTDTKAAIGRVWHEYGYLCDTHTAVAWNVAQQYKACNPSHAPVVILSTASPYKFPTAVLEAIGGVSDGDEFSVMDRLHEMTGIPVPKHLALLREQEIRHKDVIAQDEMLSYVLNKATQKKW